MKFAIHLNAQKNLLGVTHAQLVTMAAACTLQLNRDVAPHWGGGAPHTVRATSSATDLEPGEYVMSFVDTLPDAPGAIAYHDVTGAGAPVLFLALSLCETILSGSNSVSVAASHEFIETVGDPVCNLWADAGDGSEYCRELCDAVESAYYQVEGVSVSDFALPNFFNGQDKGGRYSFLGTASKPFETTSGGYQIVRTASGDTHQVTASTQRLMAAKRLHWSSRSAKRLAQRLHAPHACIETPAAAPVEGDGVAGE